MWEKCDICLLSVHWLTEPTALFRMPWAMKKKDQVLIIKALLGLSLPCQFFIKAVQIQQAWPQLIYQLWPLLERVGAREVFINVNNIFEWGTMSSQNSYNYVCEFSPTLYFPNTIKTVASLIHVAMNKITTDRRESALVSWMWTIA